MSAPSQTGSQETKTLWVGDIENWMDEGYIANLFAKVGSVVSVKIIRDKNSGAPMGYGFAEFANPEVAGKVLQVYNGAINPSTNK